MPTLTYKFPCMSGAIEYIYVISPSVFALFSLGVLGLPKMFSTTISVTLAVCFISCVSGLVLEREVANKAALKCAGSEWHPDVSVDQ